MRSPSFFLILSSALVLYTGSRSPAAAQDPSSAAASSAPAPAAQLQRPSVLPAQPRTPPAQPAPDHAPQPPVSPLPPQPAPVQPAAPQTQPPQVPPLLPPSVLTAPAPAQPAVPLYKTYDLTDGPGFCIFGGQSGKPFNNAAAFWSVIWKSDVVYVGENGGRIKDHLAQLEALKALQMRRASKVAVGFEMLNVTLQPALDDYASGKITEAEFLAKTDWAKEWDFDFGLYKPLFDYLARNKFRALALGVPKKLLSKITRTGLAGLDAGERKLLPETVSIPTHRKYLDYLKASYDAQAGSPGAKGSTWDNYLAAMAAESEAMGALISGFFNANPGWSILVISGNRRLVHNAALPASVKARTEKAYQASFYTLAAPACPAALPKADKDTANYLWYINHAPKKKK